MDGELWKEDASRVGVLAASAGDDSVALKRVSEAFVLLLDTTLGFVALLATGCSAVNGCCIAEGFNRA